MDKLRDKVGEIFILRNIYDKYEYRCDYANIGRKVKIRQVIEIAYWI